MLWSYMTIHSTKEMKRTPQEILRKSFDEVDHVEHKVWNGRWRVVSFFHSPYWLRDNNEYLLHWYRSPMPCFRSCLGSIFRLHTETGNIWTHLTGFVFFIGICVYFLCLPATYFINEWQEKVVFFLFFLSALLCFCFSALFHVMCCHSERVMRIFVRLDYSGIAILTTGSFFPWIYYCFYCDTQSKIIYMMSISVLGVICIAISQWEKLSHVNYRSLRLAMFSSLCSSAVVPVVHIIIKFGFWQSVHFFQLGWMLSSVVCYISGGFLYATRIPERYFPGKCDLWFQSHQIFHTLTVIAAIVGFHCLSNLQQMRFLDGGQCA